MGAAAGHASSVSISHGGSWHGKAVAAKLEMKVVKMAPMRAIFAVRMNEKLLIVRMKRHMDILEQKVIPMPKRLVVYIIWVDGQHIRIHRLRN